MNILLNRYSFNAFIKGVSLFSKFAFVIFLVQILPSKDVGFYSLFSATIALSATVIAFDYYTYSQRAVIVNDSDINNILSNQYTFIFFNYFIVVVLLTLINKSFEFVAQEYIVYFSIILFFETFSQESYRILVALEKETVANFLMGLNLILWPLLCIIKYFISKQLSLFNIYCIWSITSLISTIFFLLYIYKKRFLLPSKWRVSIFEIFNAIKVSSVYLVSTISYKLIDYGNRYIINEMLSIEEVAVYSFYSNIVNGVSALIYSTVVIVFYPKVIKNIGNIGQLNIQLMRFTKYLVLFFILFTGILFVILEIYFYIVNKELYEESKYILYIMLLGSFFLNTSYVPHYFLYAKRKDKQLVIIALISAILYYILTVILVFIFGLLGAPLAYAIVYVFIMILKYLYMYNLNMKVKTIPSC